MKCCIRDCEEEATGEYKVVINYFTGKIDLEICEKHYDKSRREIGPNTIDIIDVRE